MDQFVISVQACSDNDESVDCYLHPCDQGFKILEDIRGAAVFSRVTAEMMIIDMNLFEAKIVDYREKGMEMGVELTTKSVTITNLLVVH